MSNNKRKESESSSSSSENEESKRAKTEKDGARENRADQRRCADLCAAVSSESESDCEADASRSSQWSEYDENDTLANGCSRYQHRVRECAACEKPVCVNCANGCATNRADPNVPIELCQTLFCIECSANRRGELAPFGCAGVPVTRDVSECKAIEGEGRSIYGKRIHEVRAVCNDCAHVCRLCKERRCDECGKSRHWTSESARTSMCPDCVGF